MVNMYMCYTWNPWMLMCLCCNWFEWCLTLVVIRLPVCLILMNG